MSTRGLALVFGFVLLPVAGCGSRGFPPPLTIAIPNDVPETLEVTEKNGDRHTEDGRELYAGGYRAGWKECARQYQAGRLNLESEYVEPPSIQDITLAVRGWEDGYRACWRAIREAKR
jgi:hypothetical protein